MFKPKTNPHYPIRAKALDHKIRALRLPYKDLTFFTAGCIYGPNKTIHLLSPVQDIIRGWTTFGDCIKISWIFDAPPIRCKYHTVQLIDDLGSIILEIPSKNEKTGRVEISLSITPRGEP